jgi:hypothetical protein
VLYPLTVVVLVLAVALLVIAGWYAARNRLLDDRVLGAAALLEVALLVQLVVGLTRASAIADGAERATFIAYLFTVLVVAPVAILIAIKEKTQWSMGVVLAAAFVVAVLVARLQQVWTLHA